MRTRVLAIAAAAFALTQGAAHAATVIVEPPAAFNCGAAGCVDPKQHGFSQLIDFSHLTGPITISGLSFDRALLGQFGNSLLHISFWTNNGQTLVDDFGDYLAAVLAGDTLTLNGHMFVWDADNTDLTFKIEIENWVDTGPAGGGGGGGANILDIGDPGDGDPGDGVQTFSFVNDETNLVTTDTAVPEPASWALMILGFGGLGAMLRQRRRGVEAIA